MTKIELIRMPIEYSRLLDWLNEQDDTEYKIIIPRNYVMGEPANLIDQAHEFLFLAFIGQCFAEISTSFSYEMIFPRMSNPLILEITCTDRVKLVDTIFYLFKGLPDPVTREQCPEVILEALHFFDKVRESDEVFPTRGLVMMAVALGEGNLFGTPFTHLPPDPLQT